MKAHSTTMSCHTSEVIDAWVVRLHGVDRVGQRQYGGDRLEWLWERGGRGHDPAQEQLWK